MKSLFTFLAILAISFSSSSQTISGTEAVEYDPTGNRFLITNGSSILQQASGSDELEFFGNSDADYGMEVIENTLYTISGGGSQSIKFHDLTTEEELNSISIPASGFLNGMASDPIGNRIWVTDFSNNTIYEIDVTDAADPMAETVVSNTGCTPNGVTYEAANNRLVFTCWSGGAIKEVDLSDYSVSTLTNTGLSQIDGIDHDENGKFYISSWSPTRITLLNNEFSAMQTITAPGLSSPADISYAVEIDTLAVANSGNNTITYIYLGDLVNVNEIETANTLTVYPNPISEGSYISFELAQNSPCEISIYDTQGKLVYALLNETMPAGEHKVLLAGFSLETGSYICELKTGNSTQNIHLIKK